MGFVHRLGKRPRHPPHPPPETILVAGTTTTDQIRQRSTLVATAPASLIFHGHPTLTIQPLGRTSMSSETAPAERFIFSRAIGGRTFCFWQATTAASRLYEDTRQLLMREPLACPVRDQTYLWHALVPPSPTNVSQPVQAEESLFPVLHKPELLVATMSRNRAGSSKSHCLTDDDQVVAYAALLNQGMFTEFSPSLQNWVESPQLPPWLRMGIDPRAAVPELEHRIARTAMRCAKSLGFRAVVFFTPVLNFTQPNGLCPWRWLSVPYYVQGFVFCQQGAVSKDALLVEHQQIVLILHLDSLPSRKDLFPPLNPTSP